MTTKKALTLFSLTFLSSLLTYSQTDNVTLLDLCEKNSSSSYKVYNTTRSIASGKILQVRTSRYTDFYPTLSGKGSLEIYSGGERTYLGNHSDKSYPNWTSFTGKVDIYPYKEVDAGAGFYGVIMNTNGKSYSPEDSNPASKINTLLNNNKVTLHEGAAIATEKSAAGIRIGELNTEAGSRLYGYYKSQSATSTAYYLLGALNTNATLAGVIASAESKGTPDTKQAVGIIKEGKGTYQITGNENQISGALRINAGTVLVNNDKEVAKNKKLTGGTGAAASAGLPVVYVFKQGILGGTGNIGGGVDLYGKVQPGDGKQGKLVLANYVTKASCDLTVHPASIIECSITEASKYSSLEIDGNIINSNLTQDFTESSSRPQIIVELDSNHQVKVGDSYTLVHASKGRQNAGIWFFNIVLPEHLTWSVSEKNNDDGSYSLVLTCTSLTDGDNGNTEDENPDESDDPEEEDLGPVPNMGISKVLGLRKYLEMVNDGKRIGVAVPSSWTYNVPANPSSTVSSLIANNFNLCVAENEMKIDQTEPSQDSFNFSAGQELINFAKNKKMDVRGHTLVWHSQVPDWISKDGKSNDKGWTREQLLKIMENHITKVVKQFGSVCEWDVVNETLDDDQSIVRTSPTKYKMRQESVWVKVIGEDFVDSAFVYAHRANPNAKLYLNDYGAEYSGDAKTRALFNLTKRLKDSGIPIDGVGLQCHLHADDFNKSALDQTVKKYATINMNCILTEIDIAIYSTTTADYKKQGDVFKQITEVFLRNENCPNMIVWGINDQYSWISDRHPLLFDENNTAKVAYRSVREALYEYASRALYATPVSTLEAKNDEREIRRFNVMGQTIGTPMKGMNIVQYSDGKARKVMVK